MSVKWMRWPEIPWLSDPSPTASAWQLALRSINAAKTSADGPQFLRQILPDLATDLSVRWAGVLSRDRLGSWSTLAECGHFPLDGFPYPFFQDAFDEEAAGLRAGDGTGWSVLAAPLDPNSSAARLLVLVGRELKVELLGSALLLAKVLGTSLALREETDRRSFQNARLKSTLQVASNLAGVSDVQSLLELIAEKATTLLECDRASIFIWDREQREVVACPALGIEGGTLRLPDNAGIVGEVIQSGRSIRVDDAYNDARFNQSVDKSSGYTTRNLLCVPLLDAGGELIGAFEGINKHAGDFSSDDEECLTLLGIQAAIALNNTREREQLVRTRQQLTAQLTQGVQIIGESSAIVALRGTISRLASTDLPVLILGESGTGKEVVAQALHFHGARADRPFVAVNCAALAETLLESELFGHEKGAFTDARDTRQGKFELAEGGTLFLDEIGDLSPAGQAKLLRVLEQKVVTRVGGSADIPINVRVLAATNANLAEAVRDKKFREDLYYRLSVVTLDLPPLRDRPEDVLPLANYFLKQFAVQARRPALQLSVEARRRLQAHSWPGNIRELRNVIERVSFLCPGDRVEADDLAFILSPQRESALDLAGDLALSDATKRFQQEFIRQAVRRVKGNMSEAAKLLGLHRSNLYRKMRQLEMSEAESAKE